MGLISCQIFFQQFIYFYLVFSIHLKRNFWIFLIVGNQIRVRPAPIAKNSILLSNWQLEMKFWNLDDIARSTFFASALKLSDSQLTNLFCEICSVKFLRRLPFSNQSFRCGSYFDWLRFYYHQPIIIRSAPSVLIPFSFDKQNLSSIFIRSSKRKFDIFFLKISIHFLSLWRYLISELAMEKSFKLNPRWLSLVIRFLKCARISTSIQKILR